MLATLWILTAATLLQNTMRQPGIPGPQIIYICFSLRFPFVFVEDTQKHLNFCSISVMNNRICI